MKFKSKELSYGDKRIRTKFLFFPVTIGLETRWLETATFEEVWAIGWVNRTFLDLDEWIKIRFIDPDKVAQNESLVCSPKTEEEWENE